MDVNSYAPVKVVTFREFYLQSDLLCAGRIAGWSGL